MFRAASGRIVAALAARFRNLALAEDAFSESCLRAVRVWPERGIPDDTAAWLYRVAERIALDMLRKERVAALNIPDEPAPEASAEDILADDGRIIPDERLRLIFICCHPAVVPDTRAALTLRLVCGLTVTEIARAFLLQEATLAQRLVRAKRKIGEAGVPFELPPADHWPDRIEAVLSTLEVAYSKAHEDAAGTGAHAGFAAEVLHLTKLLTELTPDTGEAFALAAMVHYAEARRPSRIDASGTMVPLSEQDPRRWRRDLIVQANAFLEKAKNLVPASARTLQATLQEAWCARRSPEDPAPWQQILQLYDRLLTVRDDAFVRLNRAVALGEVRGPLAALAEVERLELQAMLEFLPYHAVRAEQLRRVGRFDEARDAYGAALALDPPSAERRWLERHLNGLRPASD